MLAKHKKNVTNIFKLHYDEVFIIEVGQYSNRRVVSITLKIYIKLTDTKKTNNELSTGKYHD